MSDSRFPLAFLLFYLCSLPFSWALSANSEICLYMPYITSVSDISYVVTAKDPSAKEKKLSFTLDLIIDHNVKVRLENIQLTLKFNDTSLENLVEEDHIRPTFDTSETKIIFLGKSQENILTQDGSITWTARMEHERARRKYEANKGTRQSVNSMIGLCSLAYDSDTLLPVEGSSESVHYRTRGFRVCRTKGPEEAEKGQVYPTEFVSTSTYIQISAGAYLDNFILHCSEGELLWLIFNGNSSSGDWNELFSKRQSKNSFQYLAQTRLVKDKERSFITNPKCKEPIQKLENMLDYSAIKELEYRLPMRFITKSPIVPNQWIFMQKFMHSASRDIRSNDDFPLAEWPNDWAPNMWPHIVMAASCDTQMNVSGLSACSYISANKDNSSLNYSVNAPQYITSENPTEYPDDIVHWSACKKLISFYGYLYTMHDYGQDFVTTPSEWHLLDFELFPLPVEAVHAEGNEFWFFSRLYDVDVMIADPSDCSQLRLTRKNATMHWNDLFKINSTFQPQSSLYYDFAENAWSNGFKLPARSDSLFIILLIACIVLILVNILICVYMRKRAAKDALKSRLKSKIRHSTDPSVRSLLHQSTFKEPATIVSFIVKSATKSPSRGSSIYKSSGTVRPAKSDKHARRKRSKIRSPRKSSPVAPARRGSKDTSLSTAL